MEQQEDKQIEQLYKETFPLVARLLKDMGGDLAAAKDVFHDALIIYLEKSRANKLDIKTSPRSYIAGIARILYIRKFNDEVRYTGFDYEDEQHPELRDFYKEKQSTRSLLSQLRYAGERCLKLLQAFYYKNLSTQQVAETLNYGSVHSVSVQKYKCLEKVRSQIKQTEVYEEYIA
jgi:RNA polymerase sigma factor (sigma-70 family)